MNKKNSGSKTIIIIVVIAVVILGGYSVLSNKTDLFNKTSTEEKSELQKLLSKDLTTGYPSTPREVVKLYSRIIKCLYNEKLSDEQVNQLADQMRILFDDELLENNPIDKYLVDLKSEIKEYQSSDRTLMSYVIEKNSSVDYYSKNNKEYGSIKASFTLKEKSDYIKTYEQFTFRKDDSENWKILGWQVISPIEIEE